MFHRIRQFACLIAALGALVFAPGAPPVWAADQVVNDCSNDTELFWDLYAMESGGAGGTLTFNCGTATIVLTRDMPNIQRTSTIDGGGAITLSGNNTFRILVIQAALTLNNITLTNGYSNNGGLLLVDNGGSLTANNVTLQNSRATDKGGALYIYPGMAATLTNVLVNGNQALSSAGTYMPQNSGGGIYMALGNLTLTDSTVTGNQAYSGGGIYNDAQGVMALSKVTLGGNSAVQDGGAIYSHHGVMELINVTLRGNDASSGGGIHTRGTATLTNVTLSINLADVSGGGIDTIGTATLTLTNVTLSGNSADVGGGIRIGFAGTATLTNVTLSGNSAILGGGISKAQMSQVTLKNTLIAIGGSGQNCSEVSSAGNFNLSNDNSCGFGAGRDHVILLLGPLANNGGSTQTHLPQPGSPAIDNGTFNGAPNTDQRGISRPQGVAVDVGTVERHANDGMIKVYLPVVIR